MLITPEEALRRLSSPENIARSNSTTPALDVVTSASGESKEMLGENCPSDVNAGSGSTLGCSLKLTSVL